VPLPRFIPIAPRKIAGPVDHPGMSWELKHDGFRALLYLDRGRAQFASRRDIVLARFQPLADRLAEHLGAISLVLDGELCVLDDAGRSHFRDLLRRDAVPVFYCFDILMHGEDDVRREPLTARRRRLEDLRGRARELVIGSHIVGDGIALFGEVCRANCEGIVGKPLESPYEAVGGKSPWVKVLNPDYTQKRGRAEAFNRRR